MEITHVRLSVGGKGRVSQKGYLDKGLGGFIYQEGRQSRVNRQGQSGLRSEPKYREEAGTTKDQLTV
jgi:hypothetical protein